VHSRGSARASHSPSQECAAARGASVTKKIMNFNVEEKGERHA
jgi:hypothetical protein